MSNLRFPYGRRHHADPIPAADALTVEHLTARYPGVSRCAINDISFNIAPGMRVALVGPNGSGKSTLLKVIAGLLPACKGTVRIYGHPIGTCHHRVAYLPQRGDIDWAFPISVERLVLTGRYVHLGWLRRPGPQDYQIVRKTLEHLGLGDLADRQIGRLSGGQQQRALLARALAQGADLLLLDEPLNAVDSQTRDVIHSVLQELKQGGKSLLAATHDVGILKSEFDEAIYLNEGRRVLPPSLSSADHEACPRTSHEVELNIRESHDGKESAWVG